MDDNVADEGKLAIDALDLLTIGEMSERFGITLRALRFYEARGLLSPQRAGSVRLYGPTDTRRLALILKGKHLGFTLTEIRAMVATDSGEAAARGELRSRPTSSSRNSKACAANAATSNRPSWNSRRRTSAWR
jgi:DNA-binding transcriptional MerR regulator